MLPERGGANAMTLLIVDRLTELGGPVTVDELTDAIEAGSGVLWNYVSQRYQQRMATNAARYRGPERDRAGGSARSLYYDEALGWSHPGFDGSNPKQRRAALRFVIGQTLADQRLKARKHGHEGWAIKHEGPPVRWSRNPEFHPRVVSSGVAHQWTPERQAESVAVRDEAVKAINLGSLVRWYEPLGLAERGTLIRKLADVLPRPDKSRASRLRDRVAELDRMVGGDPAKAVELLAILLAIPLDEG
jgi:hypothetical protein